MPAWSRIRGVCRTLAGRGRIRRDLNEEIDGYFDTLVDEYVAQGSSTERARRQARLDMEGVEQVKESVRASRPAAWLDTIVRDIWYSVRLLSKTPAFSLTAVLVLSHTAWKRLGGGPDVLGRTLVVNAHPFTVVGIAPEGFAGTLLIMGPDFWMPLGAANLLTGERGRAATSGSRPTRSLMIVVRLEDTRLAVLELQTLDQARDTTGRAWVIRSEGQIFGAFGGIALLMATIGLYGVKAYLVARRTREIGIRLALGAHAGDVVRMLVREGVVLLAASISVGLLAIGLGQAISSLLVGVQAFDPLVLSMASGVLCLAVLEACYLPARRATRGRP